MAESAWLTYPDLARFPDDGMRRELIGGELIVSPSPRTRHQEVLRRLAVMFSVHIDRHGGGRIFIAPLDVVFSEGDVTEPDLLFVANDQLEIVTEMNVRGAPALVIEVLSEPRIDRIRKRDLYARFGVPEYWIVDTEADRVEVYRLEAGSYAKPMILEPGDALGYERLPELSIDLSPLFAE